MTREDAADLLLLNLANDRRKFAIQVGYPFDAGQTAAFERGIDNEWFALVDVSPIAAAPRVMMRVFRLTDTGLRRLAELKNSITAYEAASLAAATGDQT